MTRSSMLGFSVAAGLLCLAAGAAGQPRGLEVFRPDRPSLGRAVHEWRPAPGVRDLYPASPKVPDAVGFVAPLTRDVGAGRVGVAGWTSATVPTGSRAAGDPDNPGWLGFGVAIQWPNQSRTSPWP